MCISNTRGRDNGRRTSNSFFWSSFGLTAYDENSVPDNAQLPYITYSVGYDSFDYAVSMSASIWDRTMSWAALTDKAHQISDAIGKGKILITDYGGIVINSGSPFYQRVDSGDSNIKRIFINIQAEYIQD